MTTVVRPQLGTAFVAAERFAVGKTARASDASVLVDLCNDASGGHCPQRASINRTGSGTSAFFYDPRSEARLLSLTMVVSWDSTWDVLSDVLIDLSVTDGTATIASSNAAIPIGLKADRYVRTGIGLDGRFANMTQTGWHLDKDALVTAGLSATVPWVFIVALACGSAGTYVENITFEEVSRFSVDSQDDPRIYLSGSVITSTLNRIPTVLNNAYDRNRRTYHNLNMPTSSPLAVTAAAWAYIPNTGVRLVQSYGTTPMPWTVCPRRILGAPALEWGCYYKTSLGGAGNDGYLELTTGVGSYTLTLPASVTWTFATVASGFLLDAATDTISWRAYVDGGGTLSLASFWVCDDPVPGP